MTGLTEIFGEALEIPEDRRGAFLDEACRGDSDLRAEIESLLSYYRGDTITGAPATGVPSDSGGRFRWRTKRVRRRMGLVALALAVLTGLSGFLTDRTLRPRLEGALASKLSSTLESGVVAHRAWIEEWKTELATYAEDPLVRAHLLELASFTLGREVRASEVIGRESHKELQRLVRPLSSRESVRNVNAANRENLIVFFDELELADRVYRLNPDGARRLAPALAGTTAASAPHRIRSNLVDEAAPGDSTQILIVTPVRDEAGVIFAVLTLRLNPEVAITRLLHDALGDGEGDMYAVDRQGMLVSRSRNERQLERISLLAEGRSSVVNISSRDPGGDLAEGFAPDEPPIAWPLTKMATLATAGHSGGDVEGYRDLRGKEVVGAWEWLPDYEIAIAHEIEKDRVYAPLQRARLGFGVLVLALGGFAGYAFLSTVSIRRWRERVLEAELLGQYRLEESIGEGGMAEVYRGRHALLQRPVAIKVLRGDRITPDALARFKREVKIVSRLNHRNTIQILDYGQTAEGSPFFVMELVSGITLSDLVGTDGALPIGRAVSLLAQVCQSLSEAHLLGIVHRDIKPANIMVGERPGEVDVVKVLDFGLARMVAQASTQITQQHSLGGTLVYIAPERVQNPAVLNPASDVYAVGAVAFYLVTGHEIIEGGSPQEVLMRTMAGPQVAPSSVATQPIPADLDRLVLRCLSAQPDDRPTVGDCLGVLETLGRECPWTEEESRDWWRRHREARSRQEARLESAAD